MFIFQNLLGPTFSTLLTGLWQVWTPAISFFGIGLGLWITSFLNGKSFFENTKFEKWISYVLFYSFIFSFYSFSIILRLIDASILELAQKQNSNIIEGLMAPVAKQFVSWLILVSLVPFIVFGVYLGKNFLHANVKLKTYLYELVAIFFGTLLCIWLLEGQSWKATVFSVIIFSFVGILLIDLKTKNKKPILIATGLTTFLLFFPFWNPQRDLNLVVRDFKKEYQVKEIETRWKSFAKTQLLKIKSKDFNYDLISIGDGTGIAKYFSYDFKKYPPKQLITTKLATLVEPKKVLVLFAGTGAELISLHAQLGNKVQTYGVEINSVIKDLVFKYQKESAKNFFKAYNSQYIISDNRKFLETTNEKFDSIIYSWSGATLANLSGALIHTTQYSFTVQAFQKAINLLSKNGVLIVMGGNKLNILMSLKWLESNGYIYSIKDHIVMLDSKNGTPINASWDNFILLYKKTAWEKSEVSALEEVLKNEYKIVLGPNYLEQDKFKIYQQLIDTNDYQDESKKIWQTSGLMPTLNTDDYPFAYRNYPSHFDQDGLFWLEKFSHLFTTINFDSFEGTAWLFAIFILLLTISIKKKKVLFTVDFINFLSWGPLSTAINLLFLYRAILYVGQPTWAFLTIILTTQIGGVLGYQLSKSTFNLNSETLFGSILCILFLILYILRTKLFNQFMFETPVWIGVPFLVFFIISLNILISSYYLEKVKMKDPVSFLSYWTFETIFNGVCVILGIFLIEEAGLRFCVMAMIGLSISMIILPKIFSFGFRTLKR